MQKNKLNSIRSTTLREFASLSFKFQVSALSTGYDTYIHCVLPPPPLFIIIIIIIICICRLFLSTMDLQHIGATAQYHALAVCLN